MAEEGLKRKLTAILSADVVSYSRLTGSEGKQCGINLFSNKCKPSVTRRIL